MKKLPYIIAAALSFAQLSAAVTTGLSDQKVGIDFVIPDKDQWTLGDDTKNETMRIRRYVRDGENVNLWSEQFSVYEYYGVTINVKEFFDNFLKNLKQKEPDAGIDGKIISQDSTSLVGKWWVAEGVTAESAWLKVMTDNNNVVMLMFESRRMKSASKEGAKWEKALESAKLTTPVTQ